MDEINFKTTKSIWVTEGNQPHKDRGVTCDNEIYLNWLLKKADTPGGITQEEAITVNRVFGLIQGKPKELAAKLEHDLNPEEMLSIDATSINAEKTSAEIRILDERRRRLDEIETKIKEIY